MEVASLFFVYVLYLRKIWSNLFIQIIIMKKVTLILTLPFFVLITIGVHVPYALAQTSSYQSQLELIQQLTKQIQDLQAQISTLRQQQTQLRQQRRDEVKELVQTLREGAQSDQVKVLQALLASDEEIYPEGLITGYFGRLTSTAVRRFQAKHGLEQVGQVGPRTLKRLNDLLGTNPLALETSTSTDDGTDQGKKPCAIIPPGHLIAPGWLRKQGGVRPVVPTCQVLPPGIAKKLDGSATTTPPTPPTTDTAPPLITLFSATSTATSTATVTWMTNEAATSKVYYATSPLADLASAAVKENLTLVTSHSVELTGLSASSTYYYVAQSKDTAANIGTSGQQTFVTLP